MRQAVHHSTTEKEKWMFSDNELKVKLLIQYNKMISGMRR